MNIRSTDGLSIEAELDQVEGAVATLVLCHPHPQMGGTMNAPLLLAIRDEMVGKGWNVLRFNYRGIGKSEGSSSTGTAELHDAEGALVAARELGVPVAIAGWSFGAAIAIRVAAATEPIGCLGIAPAIDEKPGVTDGVKDAVPRCPTLLVVGANDQHTSPQRAEEWSREHGFEVVVMPGANHFFWGKYDDLTGTIVPWLQARLS